MLRKDLIRYLSDCLADDGATFKEDEVARAADLALREYATLSPFLLEVEIATATGTLRYDLPAAMLGLLAVTNAAGGAVDADLFNRQLRLATDPGDGTVVALIGAAHPREGDDYPSIPDHHLAYVGDLGHAILLARLADEVNLRPAAKDGQNSEDWSTNGRAIRRRAEYLRATVRDALTDYGSFVG